MLLGITGAWAQPNFNCSGGSGTKTDPWLISSIKDMNELARQMNMEIGSDEQKRENPHLWGNLAYWNGYCDCYFLLTCDLDYSNEPVVNGSNYIPVGVVNPFGGIFDGGGHTISGIIINRTEKNNGIFGNVSGALYSPEYGPGTIKNLTLANSTITGGNYTGGIVGDCRSRVENCHVLADCTIAAAADGTECVGGIAGRAWYLDAGYYNLGGGQIGGYWTICRAEVEGCTNAAKVSTGDKSNCSQLGGIAGGIARGGNVFYCLNVGEVDTRVVNTSAGGVVGHAITGDYMGIGASYYAAPCNVGGLYGEDTEGARMAVILDAAPEDIGEQVEIFDSFEGAPGLTVYKNGIYYNGKYYYYDKKLGEFFPLYEGDEGTEARPYQIKTEDDLRTLAKAVDYDTNFADCHFVLTADLDFGGGTEGNFKPIGGVYKFAGTFDGQGHTISGIVVDRPNPFNGLFGKAGNVKNLVLSNSTIVANCIGSPSAKSIVESNSGGLVGYLEGTVENCHVTSSVTIRVAGDFTSSFGGIAGYAEGKILGCTSEATVTSEFAGSCYLGGIVGKAANVAVNHCINLGPVISDNEWAGSIVGFCQEDKYYSSRNPKFEMCYYAGQSTKGGLAGAEADNVWKAEELTKKPTAFMTKVSEYKTIGNMAAITVYKNCLLYNGIYYYHNPKTPVYGHFPRYDGDEGTAEKPFQIKTVEDLQALGQDVNKNQIDFTDIHFALKNDIDFKGYDDYNGSRYWQRTNYTPIGWYAKYPFVATFDGEGHTISGISLRKDEDNTDNNRYVGIFGRLGEKGVIRNLSAGNSIMCALSHSGPIVGEVMGRVENCHTLADFILEGRYDYGSSGDIGGIAGVVQPTGIVTGCTNQTVIPRGREMGGIVGFLWSGSTLSNCLNLGKITVPEGQDAEITEYGGIAGDIVEGGEANVTNCLYASECTMGGINCKDTDGARKAVVSTTKPEGIGEVVTTLASYEGAPGLTVYTGGLFFDGVYYVPSAGGDAPSYTAADIVRLVNIIAGKEPYSADADVNGDGKVDVADVIAIANIILAIK